MRRKFDIPVARIEFTLALANDLLESRTKQSLNKAYDYVPVISDYVKFHFSFLIFSC